MDFNVLGVSLFIFYTLRSFASQGVENKSIKSSICSGQPPSSTRDILNSTDDALTLKLVEPFIGADQEILVCNLLDEVFSSVKHLLLVTKIFHNYRAMATDEVHNQVHLLPSRNFLDKAETKFDLKHYFKACSILHQVWLDFWDVY